MWYLTSRIRAVLSARLRNMARRMKLLAFVAQHGAECDSAKQVRAHFYEFEELADAVCLEMR